VVNHLAGERSPYLLQHAENPVDWYPWGGVAFDAAKRDDKPIFLSIGYSTCHWCHVMAHESFEDPSIAAILNRDFVSVKVDREERPDVDRVYMTFVQATTGAGGWPMSVWLTPDLKPFFGGTYFPPSSRWGRPGFSELLAQIARSWHDDRPRILQSADSLVRRMKEATGADQGAPDRAPVASRAAIDVGITAFAQAFDARHWGFGGAPKFPRPSELLFLLQAHALTGSREARQMALDTLRAMALGGIRDHVGGGLHRYSVDAEWRVPHFEKMLYDQAQFALANLEAAQASGDAFYAAVAEDTLDYVLRDLTADGAFHSAEDADSVAAGPPGQPASSEKREGAFYVWTAAEIDGLFGADAAIVGRRFGVEPGGNAPADPQGEFTGQNILYIAQSIEAIATRSGRPADDVTAVLARARLRLFEARATRPRPHRDDKVITAWNGLMIAAFARAARTLVESPRRADWLRAAEGAAAAIESHLWRPADRRLFRRYRAGDAAIDGFCEDYACLAWGLIELFQATGDARWLTWALELMSVQTALFWDAQDGGWFSTTGHDLSVLLRLKEDYDGAEPAAASISVRNLLTLGHLVADSSLIDRAGRTLERYGPEIGRVARVMPFMLSNIALWHGGATQVVIVGAPDDTGTRALEAVVAGKYLPRVVHIPVRTEQAQRALAAVLPWIGAMPVRPGQATAYVCHDFTCQAPVTDPAALDAQLDQAVAPTRILWR
jgi:uncharacterized protein YyaL (SSP411 family)